MELREKTIEDETCTASFITAKNNQKQMKTYYINILLIILAVNSWGCKKDLLNVKDPNNVNEENFYKTANDAVLGTNSVYGTMYRKDNFGWVYIWESVLTDDERWDSEGSPALYGGVASGIETALGSNSYVRRVWNASYATIARANVAIAKIPAIEMDETLKNRLLAECRFFRAFMYQRLLMRYGDVPLMLKLPSEDVLLPSRSTKAEVLKVVFDDLNFAAQYLPKEYTGVDIGRVKKGAALVLKARVEMSNQMWTEAAASAKACLDLNYGLNSSYSDLFNKPGTENLGESLFEIQWGNSAGDFGSQINTRYTDNGEATTAPGGWNWGQVLQNLVNEYDNADGTPFVLGARDVRTDLTQYQNRDPRLAATINYEGSDYFGIPWKRTWTATMYGWKKYTISSAVLNTLPKGTIPYNWIVLRNAEAYLSYAEAQNEAVGPDPSVYAAIKEIRRRAGISNPDLPAGLTKEEMRNKIRHERRVELAGESVRFEDLLRWKTLKSALENKHLGNPGVNWIISNWGEFRYLWPIPQQERDLNKNLTQNAGY